MTYNKKKRSFYEGITLISLVVTIVVLIILAGITMATLTGENGILTKTTEAKEKTEKANELEQVQLVIISAEVTSDKQLTTENLQNKLRQELEYGTLYGDGPWIMEGKWNNYKIETDGTIEVKEFGDVSSINKTSLTLDGAYLLMATGTLSEGNVANNLNYIWTTEDSKIATVTPDGIVKCGTEMGTTKIYCRGKNTTLECQVTTTAKKVSSIQGSNKTINGGTANFANPTIPTGYVAIDTQDAKWDIEELQQSDINKGLVIMDEDGNQFVWIPVQIPVSNTEELATENKAMAVKINDNYRGLLYDFTDNEGTATSEVRNECTTTTVDSREPDILEVDTDENLQAIGLTAKEYSTEMQNNYNEMIESVLKYGGFYVGRYETSYNEFSKRVASVAGATSANETNVMTYQMYGFYQRQKEFSNSDQYSSTMIWGSQYDAVMNWMMKNDINVASVTPITGATRNTSRITGSNSKDKLNNIFDLMGNSAERTLTASNIRYSNAGDMLLDANKRICKGGIFKSWCITSPSTAHTYNDVFLVVTNSLNNPINYGSRISIYCN